MNHGAFGQMALRSENLETPAGMCEVCFVKYAGMCEVCFVTAGVEMEVKL